MPARTSTSLRGALFVATALLVAGCSSAGGSGAKPSASVTSTHTIDATQLALDFFEHHPRPR
jgi:hypothetical protein